MDQLLKLLTLLYDKTMNNTTDLTQKSPVEFHNPTPDIQFAIYGLIVPVITVSGMLANFVSIIIFKRPSMRSVVNTYLAGLSCFDLAVLLFAMVLYPSMSYCLSLHMQAACTVFKYGALIVYPMSLAARFGSVWSCVFITIDRFIAVAFPLQRR